MAFGVRPHFPFSMAVAEHFGIDAKNQSNRAVRRELGQLEMRERIQFRR